MKSYLKIIVLLTVVSGLIHANDSGHTAITDANVQKVLEFRAHTDGGHYEEARALMTSDPRRWFNTRTGQGSSWNIGPGKKAPWARWDEVMEGQKQEVEWRGTDSTAILTMRETNQYFQMLERGWVTTEITYYFDTAGKISGLLIQAIGERPPGRTDEFLHWAHENHPEEIQYLMPKGEVDPSEDRPERYRALLTRWRSSLESIEITYVANEGVLISSGEDKILIDAIHAPYSSRYLAPDDATLQQMMDATPPFDSVDLLLVSHVHGDHFDGKSVAQFLSKNQHVRMFATAQAVDSVMLYLPETERKTGQITQSKYGAGVIDHFEHQGISVSIFRVVHGGARNAWIENVGHLIEIGGKTLLHVGDPNVGEEDLRRANITDEQIDIGILPYWLMLSNSGRHVVDEIIRPKQIIAVHIPVLVKDSDLSEIKEHYPDAVPFTEPGTVFKFDKE